MLPAAAVIRLRKPRRSSFGSVLMAPPVASVRQPILQRIGCGTDAEWRSCHGRPIATGRDRRINVGAEATFTVVCSWAESMRPTESYEAAPHRLTADTRLSDRAVVQASTKQCAGPTVASLPLG